MPIGKKRSWKPAASKLRWCACSDSAAQRGLQGETGMDRRKFSATAAIVAGAGALGWPHLALAQMKPQDGREFRSLNQRALVEAPAGKIEVVEFFWYSCPHCNAFEPTLAAWLKKLPADVSFRRVPVAFRDEFVPQQRLFYTLEAMDKLGELHAKVFQEIHQYHQPTDREDRILAFAGKYGLDQAKFQELYNSPAISAKARNAWRLQEQYQVDGVPAIGVAGRFYTDGSIAGGMVQALQVTDYLVGESRKG
jgi:protein dithiol oxidoreductase (disulfide-forming)